MKIHNKSNEYLQSAEFQRQVILWKRRLGIAVMALSGAALASGCAHHHAYSYNNYSSSPAGYTAQNEQQQQTLPPTGRQEDQNQQTTAWNQNNTVVIPLYRESVNVGKREVGSGEVRLKKVVRTETVNQPVELRHEEVVINRDQNAPQGGNQVLAQPFQEQEYTIHLKREEPLVQKQMSPAGEIVVQTRSAEQQQNVTEQVRRDDIDITKSGDTQNVTIGQNVQAANESGGAESPAGQSVGAEASPQPVNQGPITDVTVLNQPSEISRYAGRPVQFSGLKVQEVIDERLLVLATDNGQTIYAVSNQQTKAKKGDTVDLTGDIATTKSAGSDSQTGLRREGTRMLQSQPFYIEASKIVVD